MERANALILIVPDSNIRICTAFEKHTGDLRARKVRRDMQGTASINVLLIHIRSALDQEFHHRATPVSRGKMKWRPSASGGIRICALIQKKCRGFEPSI